ncbi:MAG: ATP-binding cassette domain-containing protein, partial [Clostridia bacterium]|nr:ATP-binding cassette domain-containing protein [Clostridia bacterium]
MNSLIRFENVTFEYESDDRSITVFEDFSLEIEKGTFNVILGHNGSGKSTLAKLANGLMKPNAGSVFVEEMNTNDPNFEADIIKKVGLVFQNPDNQIVSSIVEEDV